MRKEDVLRNEMMEKKEHISKMATQARNDHQKSGHMLMSIREKVLDILAKSYMGEASKEEVDQYIQEYHKQQFMRDLGAGVEARIKAMDDSSRTEHEIKRLAKVRSEMNSLKNAIQYGAENREKYKALQPYGRDAIKEQIPRFEYVMHLDQNIQTALDLARELGEEEIFNEWLKQVANPEG